jgi:hypothetical protein
MNYEELEVYVTPDGFGRVAVMQRPDGLICLIIHWIWPDVVPYGFGGPNPRTSWFVDQTPTSDLYHDIEPRPGIYGTVEDARREICSIPGFSEAVLHKRG